MQYTGPERRLYKILVTKNTEYHMRGEECIAVRDSKSGVWRKQHVAVGSKLVGSIGSDTAGTYRLTEGPRAMVGARLCFSSDLLTTPVLSVRRPTTDTVVTYKVA
jgi:hypothetical protein